MRLFSRRRSKKDKSQDQKVNIDGLLESSNYDALIITLSQNLFNKFQKEGFDSLREPEKVFFMVDSLEMEINNGGFEQYFGNSASNYALDVPDALETIGASKTADLVRRANSLFPDGSPPHDWPKRQKLLDEISNDIRANLDELTAAFLEYRDPLSELQRGYIQKHKDEFS